MADTSQALAERRDAPAFDASKVTDQKRFVRGEQMLLARRCLRIRDEIHSAPWRIMIMAGAAPEGEINAIRELMPKAHITAIDNDERCLTAALNCGADEVVHVDLTEWGEYENTFRKKPAAKLGDRRFDVVCLYLCANVNATTKKMARVYRSLVAHYGVYIVNFSYGRDVVELFDDARLALASYANEYPLGGLLSKVPPNLVGRIAYLFPPKLASTVRSVMAYRGNAMPMCSVLLHTTSHGLSFVQTEPGDFEIAAAHPDPALLYACPQERIEALRRRHAALKAAYTLRQKRASSV
jgi:hypothetical protein